MTIETEQARRRRWPTAGRRPARHQRRRRAVRRRRCRPWDPDVVSVDWRPPGGGDRPSALALLAARRAGVAARVEAANARVVERLLGARPFLVDVRPAREVVPA